MDIHGLTSFLTAECRGTVDSAVQYFQDMKYPEKCHSNTTTNTVGHYYRKEIISYHVSL